MMKILSVLLSITALIPGLALAHPGHTSGESIHGFLHIEHIILLVLIGLILYVSVSSNDK